MVIRGRGFRTAFNDWCRGLFPVWREAFFHDISFDSDYIEADHLPDAEIWGIGSRVEGTAKPYSDLDLVVVMNGKMPFDRYLSIRNAFEESELSFRVDVMDYHRLNPSFQKKVADHHVVLFSPKSEPEIDERIVGLPQKENEAQPQQRKEKQV